MERLCATPGPSGEAPRRFVPKFRHLAARAGPSRPAPSTHPPISSPHQHQLSTALAPDMEKRAARVSYAGLDGDSDSDSDGTSGYDRTQRDRTSKARQVGAERQKQAKAASTATRGAAEAAHGTGAYTAPRHERAEDKDMRGVARVSDYVSAVADDWRRRTGIDQLHRRRRKPALWSYADDDGLGGGAAAYCSGGDAGASAATTPGAARGPVSTTAPSPSTTDAPAAANNGDEVRDRAAATMAKLGADELAVGPAHHRATALCGG